MEEGLQVRALGLQQGQQVMAVRGPGALGGEAGGLVHGDDPGVLEHDGDGRGRHRRQVRIEGHADLEARLHQLARHLDPLAVHLHAAQLQGLPGRASGQLRVLGDELVQAQLRVLGCHGEGPFAKRHGSSLRALGAGQ